MKKFLSLMIVSLLLIACKDEIACEQYSVSVELEAMMPEFEDGESTKAEIEVVTRLKWVAGDIIDVYNMTQGMSICGQLTATKSGTTSTFTGSITNVSKSDKLLFLYSKNISSDIDEHGNIVFDFSVQNGTSASNVPFLCTAVTSLEEEGQTGNSFSFSKAFQFQMAYLQLAFGNLPPSMPIESVAIMGLPYQLTLSYDSAKKALMTTSGPDILTDEDTGERYFESYIEMAPGASTLGTGARMMYITCPKTEANTDITRDIYVTMENGRQYHDVMANAKFAAAMHYRTIISNFSDEETEIDPEPLYIDAIMPQLIGENGIDAPLREWQEGDEVSVVNLTKDMILFSNLVAQRSGLTTTLYGEFTTAEGFAPGDELLLIYPAIDEDYWDTSFSDNPILINLAEQSGTIDGIPYVMTATSTLRDNLSATLAEFEYQVAVNAIEMNGMFDDFMTVDEEDVEEDVADYDIPIRQIKIASYDGEEIPTALVISYDANDGYRISTEETSDCFRLTEEYIVPLSNDNLKVYFVSPGSNGGSLSFDVSTNIYAPSSVYYLENIDKSEFYYSEDPIQIVPVTGHLKANTAGPIVSGGVDLSEVEEGGEEDDI